VRVQPGEDGGGETCRGGAIFLVAADAGYFVHGAEREAAARQGAVESGDAKRQHTMAGGLLDMPDAIAQRCQAAAVAAGGAGHVAILFFIFFDCQSASICR